MSVGFIRRNFSVQRNIFQYDLPEDIAYGNSVNFTTGALSRSNDVKPYVYFCILWKFYKAWVFHSESTVWKIFNENSETASLSVWMVLILLTL